MWTYIAIGPDGRELGRETGGRDAEARVRGIVSHFNSLLPRSTRPAFVTVVPATPYTPNKKEG